MHLFILVAVAIALVADGVAVAMVRVWNCAKETQPRWGEEEGAASPVGIWDPERSAAEAAGAAASATKGTVPFSSNENWDSPPLMPSRGGSGRPGLGQPGPVARDPYLGLWAENPGDSPGLFPPLRSGRCKPAWPMAGGQAVSLAAGAAALIPLLLLSLVLVNAQAVTSMTSERDVKALDLLLVTDLTPKEIVFGKLGGVFYNTKEMVLLPMLLCGFWSPRL